MDVSQRLVSRRRLLRGAVLAGAAIGLGVVGSELLLGGAADAYSWSRTLQQGDTGNDVKELQIRIAGWAADSAQQVYLAVDGDFGPATAAAAKRFQTAYGLPVNGVVDSDDQSTLNSLESSDGSTLHFDWTEFYSQDGSGFSGGKVDSSTVQENVRHLMYKLEAVRVKLGNKPIIINSGFRSISHNAAVGGASNSMHLYGVAADTAVSGVSNETIYQKAETSGFSGLEAYTEDHQHVDSRIEYPYGSQYWWWESGTV